MRTIIINTLGSALRQNPLFYLPFGNDRFYWMESSVDTINACVEQMCCYNDAQDVRQECHLVILVSLANYKLARYEQLRLAYKEALIAHINSKLLNPLLQDKKEQVAGVSIVFVLPQQMSGTNGIPAEDINLHILGIDPKAGQVETFALTDDNGVKTADLSDLFTNESNDYRISRQNVIDSGKSEEQSLECVRKLRSAVADKLAKMQLCKYLRPGEETPVILPMEQVEYYQPTDDWDMFSVDMQLNLCEHLQENLNSETVWALKLVPHDVQTVQQRLQLAKQRVRYLREHAPGLAFYAEDQTSQSQPVRNISGRIWQKLTEGEGLPGAKDAKLEADRSEREKQAAVEQEKRSLGKELRQAWLLIGQEKKKFEWAYDQLQKQYEPEAATRQQKQILDACSDAFVDWRREVLSRQDVFPKEATLTQLPVFDEVEHQKALSQAQQAWGEAAVSQLEDYTDVREEAEKVKADFRKAYRLWPDGEFNATSKFLIYTAVLAGLFLLQMLLPYVFITMGQEGVQLSRYLHFSLSAFVFISLYAVGLLIWMRVMCKQLHQYTMKMGDLLYKSHRRRRESIIHAVQAYGVILPNCTLCYEELEQKRVIHEENLQRRERYNTHLRLLSKADELLHELCTLLRLPDVENAGQPKVNGGIDFELAPSHPNNMPYYVFLSENWGRY